MLDFLSRYYHKQKRSVTNRLFVLLPAVVVCRHGNAGVAKARLLGQHHLWHRGHVDDVGAPLAEHQALCSGGKARTLDRQHGTSRVTLDAQTARHLHQDLCQDRPAVRDSNDSQTLH